MITLERAVTKALPLGTFRETVRVTDAARNASKARSVAFKIVKQ